MLTQQQRCLALLLSVALSIGCSIDFGDPGPQGMLGVKSKDGSFLLRVRSCSSAAVVRDVSFESSPRQTNVKNELVWAIRNEGGAAPSEFEMGKAPPSFVETDPLDEIVIPSEQYVARVNFDQGHLRLLRVFTPEKLRSDAWFVGNNRFVSDADFDAFDLGCL